MLKPIGHSKFSSINAVLKHAQLELKPRGRRTFQVRPDDTFLVSYPRSGNTWLKFILAHLLYPELKISFNNILNLMPEVEQKNQLKLEKVASPRIIKSHYTFIPEYPKVIYLVRDPRSVFVSEFFYLKRDGIIDKETLFKDVFPYLIDGFPPHMVRAQYGCWGSHVGSWMGALGHLPDRMFVLRYEDLKNDPVSYIVNLVGFLGRSFSKDEISRAVDSASFSSMKKMDIDRINRNKNIEKQPFVRGFKNDEWKNYFNDHMLHEMDFKLGSWINYFGYDLFS